MTVNLLPRNRRHVMREVSVGAVVTQVTVTGLVVIFGLAALSGVVARDAGDALSTRSFERLAGVAAASLAPSVDTASAPDLDRSADLDRQVAGMVAPGSLVGVSLTDGSGWVLWFDRAGPLLVAYIGIRDVRGMPVLLALSEHRDDAPDLGRETWSSVKPAALAALLPLALAQLPLTWWLATRLRRAQWDTAALRAGLVEAADGERRRLAADVHDTVIPVLTGAALDPDLARLRAARDGNGPALVPPDTATSVRRAIDGLRALISGSCPAPAPRHVLTAWLLDLAADQERAGISVSLPTAGLDDLPLAVSSLLYRSAGDALRNAAAHSRATSAELSAQRCGGTVTMVVDDDGSGFDAERLAERQHVGHLCLQTLADLVVEAGGSLTASSSPGQGARLVVTVPVDGAAAGVGRTT
jgi:signal transduction histidine kinase